MVVFIHIEHVHKLVCIPNIIMVEPFLKQHVVPINVLVVKSVIPLNIVKQHLPKTLFHPKVEKMIVDETPTRKQVQDLTKVGWTVIEKEQLTKVNLGTKENVQ
jgi:hypothetical protein